MNLVEAKASELVSKLEIREMAISDLDSKIKELQARKKSITTEIDSFKNDLREAMSENGITRIESDGVLFRLDKPSVQVKIDDESVIDERFFRVKKEVDKIVVKKALQTGDSVDGASLIEGKNRLTIKIG